MICKIIGNKKGGTTGSVDYLLNKRENEGTSRLLQGDPELTKSLIDTSKFAQKSVVGVLSFEEANLSEEAKREIMEEFEKSFMSGLEKEQYNILWVEHTDKGRLELNFVIPTTELSTGKRLQPYYHKADMGMKDAFQDFINLKYELSNPKNPEKEQTVTVDERKLHLKDYKELDIKLHSLVAEGKLDNRSEIIAILKDSGVEVTREGKDYISVKLPESKKAQRFKGGIYSEEFRSIGDITEIRREATARARAFDSRDTKQELGKLENSVEQYRTGRAESNKKRFSENRKRYKNDDARIFYSDIITNYDRHSNRSIELLPLSSEKRLGSAEKMADRGGEWRQIFSSTKERISGDTTKKSNSYKIKRGVEDDSTTTAIIERARERICQRDAKFGARIYRFRAEARAFKEVIFDKVGELREKVVEVVKEIKEKISEQSKKVEHKSHGVQR